MTIPTEARPGAVIGYRRNGAPIRLIAGGSQMAPEAPAAPAPEQAAPPVSPAPAPPTAPAAPRVPPGQPEGGQFAQPGQQQPAQPPAPPAQPAAPEKDWKAEAERLTAEAATLAADVDRWRRQARNQETRSKANHQQVSAQEAILRQIADKVGVPYDDRPDPEVLSARLDQVSAVARQRAIELAVFTTAAGSQANAPAILDSREFMSQAEGLDPEANDFADQVRDLVKAAASQPRYQFVQPPPPAQPATEAPAQPAQPQQQAPAAQPPAPSSGSDFSGAPAGNGLWTQADYDAYMATSGTNDRDGSKLNKAIAEGRLVNLGVGRPRGRGRR